jgi:NitT/TauT family transport system ATP-binding protein
MPAVHLLAGRNFGLSGIALARRVVLPAILPSLVVGLRLALGIAWLVVVAAEMIAVTSGLGFLIIDARNAGNRYDVVVAGMVMIGVIGVLLDLGMRRLERSLVGRAAAPGGQSVGDDGRNPGPAAPEALRRAGGARHRRPHRAGQGRGARPDRPLHRRRRGGVRVLEKVDLDVYNGELVCILGPSGCGKSTLLNVIGGFVRPTGGTVLDRRRAGDRAGPAADLRLPGARRLPLADRRGQHRLRAPPAAAAERAARSGTTSTSSGSTGFERAYPHELSGGMKQRVEVARALAVDPDVLYLDEPFGALDSITRLTMRAELLRLWQAERKTILFVTHDIEESVQLADRVVVMSQRPARIRRIVEIDIPHPRDLSAPRYLELRDAIFEEIGLAHQI